MRLTLVLLFALCSLYSIDAVAGPNEDLFTACRTGSLEGATKAINAGAKVNALDADGNSPLVWAFFYPDITKLLLEKGGNPNLGSGNAVYQASLNYSTDTLKLLLDAGADPNRPHLVSTAMVMRPLIAKERAKGAAANQAMINAWESVIKSTQSAKPNAMYALRDTVYTTSCVPCVEMLMAKGARVDLGVSNGTILHVFADSISPTPETWKKGFAQGKSNMEAFGLKLPDWYAASLPADRLGTAEQMLKPLMTKGLNINQKNSAANGMKPLTPLEVALNQGLGKKREILLALIASGADVKMVNEVYGPLIVQAAQTGFADVVQAMVEKGADINARGPVFWNAAGDSRDATTFTPLTAAALKNSTATVKYLLGAGARLEDSVNGRQIMKARNTGPGLAPTITCLFDTKDKSAIYFAVENNNLEMTKLIAETAGYQGKPYTMTALHHGTAGCVGGGTFGTSAWAVATGASQELVQYLKSRGL